MSNNSKQPLKWFEDRIGTFIYRAPFFQSEKGRAHVAIKVKNKDHAKMLHDLQRSGRPAYQDTALKVQPA